MSTPKLQKNTISNIKHLTPPQGCDIIINAVGIQNYFLEVFKMKRIVAITILLLLVAGVAFAQQMKRGDFRATVPAYNGNMTVTITVDRAGKITRIAPTTHQETPVFANPVWQQMIPAMIQKQSWDVDIVAGSTVTAEALKEAVKQAMALARQ